MRTKGAALLQQKVKEVVIVDPHRVRFVLHEPWPDFMTFYGTFATGAGWIVPKDYLEKVGPDGFKKHPIGLGPYKFVSSTPGIELVMEAYEDYWRKMPSVKRLVYKSIPEATTRLAVLKRGEVDLAYLLDATLAEEVKRDPKLKLAFSGGIGTMYLDFFDMWDPKSPWADQRVRLAASLALDRKAISEAETLGASPADRQRRAEELRVCAAARAASLRSGARQEAARRGRLSQRLRRRRSLSLAALFLDRRGDHQLSRRGRHQDARAHHGARRVLRRAGDQEAQGPVHVRRRGLRQRLVAPVGDRAEPTARSPMAPFRISTISTSASSRENDAKKRRRMLNELQQTLYDRVRFAPIYDYIWASGVGPRVEEPALMQIDPYPWSAPLEEVKLKRK